MIALVPMVICCCVACAAVWRRGQAQRVTLQWALTQAAAERAALQRLARLAGRDLRDAALRLHAQAGLARLAADSGASSALAAIAERCRCLAADLGEAGRHEHAAPPSLRDESLDLLACAREAAEAVAAVIAPGHRRFSVAEGVALVRADRRAVRQILARVLTEAALNTREGDWIALSVAEAADGGVTMIVADEGLGVAGAETGPSCDRADASTDRSGIAAPLALARTLMQAHGGALELVATPAAGTQVSLIFPPQRRRLAVP